MKFSRPTLQWLSSVLLALTVFCGCQSPTPERLPAFTGAPKQIADQHAGEGPAWHPNVGLLVSGHGDITRFAPDGTAETFLAEAGSNGLLFDAIGRLLICQPGQRRVARLSQDGTLSVLTADYQGQAYNSPNDITVDSTGRIYFSDPRYGSREDMQIRDPSGKAVEGVYRIDPDGQVTRIITHEVDRPNGVLVTPDDRYLFVADNNNNEVGGARKLWRFRLNNDGSVSRSSQKLIYDWQTGRGPDGMAIDEYGTLYVAGGRTNANLPAETAAPFVGGVYVFSPTGEYLERLPIPVDEVTNCSFGGSDLKDLYITAGGTLWSIRTRNAGRVAWSY